MTECCNAYVTFFDSTLICKNCYEEQPIEMLVNQ